MSMSTKWLVADDNGVVRQPWIRKCPRGYEFGDASPVYETERDAAQLLRALRGEVLPASAPPWLAEILRAMGRV